MEPRGGIACRNSHLTLLRTTSVCAKAANDCSYDSTGAPVARRYGEVVLLFDGLFGLGLSGLRIFLARVSACAQQKLQPNIIERAMICFGIIV